MWFNKSSSDFGNKYGIYLDKNVDFSKIKYFEDINYYCYKHIAPITDFAQVPFISAGTVIYPNSITTCSLGSNTALDFTKVHIYETVYIGKNLKTINLAHTFFPYAAYIYIATPTPPSVDPSNYLAYIKMGSGRLRVPKGSLEAYKAAWPSVAKYTEEYDFTGRYEN